MIRGPQYTPIPEEMADKVIGLVMKEESIDHDTLLSKSRKMGIVAARNLCAYLLSSMGYSNGAIGKVLHLNHATIYHSVKSVTGSMDIYIGKRKKIQRLLGELITE